jgi:membrane-bound serine protease (ClpP class)
MSKKIIWMSCVVICVFAVTFLGTAQAQEEAPLALVLTADGPVTPAMAEYLSRGIRIAEQRGAELLVFQLNTPGGGVDVMQEMVAHIRGSSVPVIVYVAPRGAIAGSAGTVITLAGHAAAMAPETAIGAASPVGSQGEDLGETIEAKEKEILKALVRSLAEYRGPEAVALAEATIQSAKAVSSSEALEIGLVDFIARDLNDLLYQLDGITLSLPSGEHVLNTSRAVVTHVDLSLIEQLLQVLTNPNIVFILLTIGVQALLIELSSPGGWVAGFIGVVCLALAVYGFGVLPVNWFGLIFLVISFVLFVLDIKAPTHGALTAAGVGSLIVGALVLFNSPATPQFQRVSVPLVVAGSLMTGGLFAAAMIFAIRAQKSPIRTGSESLAGRQGVVKDEIPAFGTGTVQVGGELWSAELSEGEESLPENTRVHIVSVRGIRLQVRKIT